MTTLLAFHIVTMVISLLGTFSMTANAVIRGTVNKVFARSNYAITMLGIISGSLLLIAHPITLKCAVLTAYLVIFLVVHHRVLAPRASTHLPSTIR